MKGKIKHDINKSTEDQDNNKETPVNRTNLN